MVNISTSNPVGTCRPSAPQELGALPAASARSAKAGSCYGRTRAAYAQRVSTGPGRGMSPVWAGTQPAITGTRPDLLLWSVTRPRSGAAD